jgi:fumarylacetoacetase
MQPLGPFLAKNFGTTVSPWVVTMEALAPFRQAQPPRPDGDPKPLPYLWHDADQQHGAFNVGIEALILTEAMRSKGMPPHRLAASNVNHLYWTIAQMVAHHTSNGCNLRPGDLLATGTVSGGPAIRRVPRAVRGRQAEVECRQARPGLSSTTATADPARHGAARRLRADRLRLSRPGHVR